MLQYVNYRMRITILDGRVLVGTLMAFDRHLNLVRLVFFFSSNNHLAVLHTPPASPNPLAIDCGACHFHGRTPRREQHTTYLPFLCLNPGGIRYIPLFVNCCVGVGGTEC